MEEEKDDGRHGSGVKKLDLVYQWFVQEAEKNKKGEM